MSLQTVERGRPAVTMVVPPIRLGEVALGQAQLGAAVDCDIPDFDLGLVPCKPLPDWLGFGTGQFITF